MEGKIKRENVKLICLIVAICVVVILLSIVLAVGSYKFFCNYNKNSNSKEVVSNNINNDTTNSEIIVSIDDNEELERQKEKQRIEEEQRKLEEEMKAQEELKKQEELKRQEEIKRQEELKKQQEEQKKEEVKNNNSGYNYYLKVNYTANTVTAYKKDANGNYTIPVRAMICSTGSATPRTGVFRTLNKYRWRLLLGNCYGQYSTRITGQILFHSVPYEKQAENTLITRYYDRLGITTSMGCIRLTVADAKWIYDNCPIGTQVEFYSSSNPGPLGKPTATKITNYGYPLNRWDPTDPNVNNPWKNQNNTNTTTENNNTTQNETQQNNNSGDSTTVTVVPGNDNQEVPPSSGTNTDSNENNNENTNQNENTNTDDKEPSDDNTKNDVNKDDENKKDTDVVEENNTTTDVLS